MKGLKEPNDAEEILVMKQMNSLWPFSFPPPLSFFWGGGGGTQQIGMKGKDGMEIFNKVGKVTTVPTVKMSTLSFGLLAFCSLQTDDVN